MTHLPYNAPAPSVADERLHALVRLEKAATAVLFAPSNAAWVELSLARRVALEAIELVGRTLVDAPGEYRA